MNGVTIDKLTRITEAGSKERGENKDKQKGRNNWNSDVDFSCQEWATE